MYYDPNFVFADATDVLVKINAEKDKLVPFYSNSAKFLKDHQEFDYFQVVEKLQRYSGTEKGLETLQKHKDLWNDLAKKAREELLDFSKLIIEEQEHVRMLFNIMTCAMAMPFNWNQDLMLSTMQKRLSRKLATGRCKHEYVSRIIKIYDIIKASTPNPSADFCRVGDVFEFDANGQKDPMFSFPHELSVSLNSVKQKRPNAYELIQRIIGSSVNEDQVMHLLNQIQDNLPRLTDEGSISSESTASSLHGNDPHDDAESEPVFSNTSNSPESVIPANNAGMVSHPSSDSLLDFSVGRLSPAPALVTGKGFVSDFSESFLSACPTPPIGLDLVSMDSESTSSSKISGSVGSWTTPAPKGPGERKSNRLLGQKLHEGVSPVIFENYRSSGSTPLMSPDEFVVHKGKKRINGAFVPITRKAQCVGIAFRLMSPSGSSNGTAGK